MISNKHFALTDSVKFEYTHVTHISQANIDCTITLVRAGEVMKYPLPSSISYRLRKSIGNVAKFASPHPICIAWVGSRIVCAECPDKSALPSAHKNQWKSLIEINIAAFKPPKDAYFDGQYVYTLDSDPEVFDRNYGVVKLNVCYDLFHLNSISWANPPRACFAYKDGNKWVTTAPCTSAAGTFLQLIADDVSTSTAAVFDSMDMIDAIRFVNLRFVNYAAGRLVDAFDFEVIEPLGLPLLMIEHGTFNLGELTPTVQMTCPAPLTFSQTLAWLIGLHQRVTTIDQFIVLKEAIKMLLSKGCTRSAAVVGDGDQLPDGAVDLSKNEIVYSARKTFNNMAMVQFT